MSRIRDPDEHNNRTYETQEDVEKRISRLEILSMTYYLERPKTQGGPWRLHIYIPDRHIWEED